MDIGRQFKGSVGTYLVAAKLSRMNLIALTTSRNTKGYDIVILNPPNNRGKGIQVKCSDKKEFPIMQSFLKDYEEEIQKRILCDFVFVDISDADKPRFFVVPLKNMKDIVKKNIETWMYNQRHKKTIEEMKKTEEKKQQWVLDLDEISGYEDKWKALTENL